MYRPLYTIIVYISVLGIILSTIYVYSNVVNGPVYTISMYAAVFDP